MAITATSESTGGNSFLVPTGTHVMRCFRMIEIGTVSGEWQGKPISRKRVWLDWELPNELKVFKEGEGEKPYSIGKEFSLSLAEKANLRAFLEGWRGKAFTEEEAKAFDITKLIGLACMGTIIEEKKGEKTYSNLTGVSALMKGLTCPQQINQSFILSYDNFDFEKFKVLPKFIQDKMKLTPEFQKVSDMYMSNEHHARQLNDNDDLPF